MGFNLLIPELGIKPKNSKDAIISILCQEWPLSSRNIFNKIKKTYGYSSTYQSVFKAVKELVEKKVLIEKDKRYEINIDWIKKLQNFTDIIETNYFSNDRIRNITGLKESNTNEDMLVLNFETIFDSEKYLYYFMKNELMKIKNDNIIFQLKNEWRPIFYLRAEYNYYKKLAEHGHKFYFFCSGKSRLEKDSMKFYESLGIKCNESFENLTFDNIIFGNYFIQVYIPEDLRIKMKTYLEKGDKILLIKEVLEKKSSIRMIINKDPRLVENLKKKLIRKN